MAKALFIKAKDLIEKTSVSGGLDPSKFRHCLDYAQDFHIEPLLGTRLYEKISNDILNNSLTGHYENLVNEYIKPALINFGMVEYLPFSAVTIANGGVFKHTSEAGELASEDDISLLISKHREHANSYAERLVNHLVEYYKERYTEYDDNENDDIHPNRSIAYTNWNLD